MNETKEIYLHRIRSQSSYPWIRRLATIVSFALYSIAFIFFFSAVTAGLKNEQMFLPFVLLGVIVSMIIAITAAVLKEAAIMLADIADSVTDLNSRYEQ